MAELLPLSQATAITDSLLDYLGTMFALADPDGRTGLTDFLSHLDTEVDDASRHPVVVG